MPVYSSDNMPQFLFLTQAPLFYCMPEVFVFKSAHAKHYIMTNDWITRRTEWCSNHKYWLIFTTPQVFFSDQGTKCVQNVEWFTFTHLTKPHSPPFIIHKTNLLLTANSNFSMATSVQLPKHRYSCNYNHNFRQCVAWFGAEI